MDEWMENMDICVLDNDTYFDIYNKKNKIKFKYRFFFLY